MRACYKQLKNRKLYMEKYDNYYEYAKVIEEREKQGYCKDCDNTLEKRAQRPDFSYTKNYKEAKNLLMYGWDKPVEQLKVEIDKEVKALMQDKNISKMFNDVVGFMPVVPNAILGLPQSMINIKKDSKKQRIIHFLIDTTYKWSTELNEVVEKYSKIIARICVLEHKGYRCRISTFNQYSYDGERKTIVSNMVKVKDEMQPLDVKRLSFTLAHTAFFRVYGFAWENSLPIKDEYHNGGLGRALNHWPEDERKEVIDAIKEGNEKIIYVWKDSNLKEVFNF